MRKTLFALLMLGAILPLAAETFTYGTYMGEKRTGTMTVEYEATKKGAGLTVDLRGEVAVIFSVEYGMDASLEYDREGELISGRTHVNGMGADIAMEFVRDNGEFAVERNTGHRGWLPMSCAPFRATTLFFHNPVMIEKLRNEYPRGGTLSLLDIEDSRTIGLDFEFSRDRAAPWGEIVVMSNKDMVNYFDPVSHRLLYSEVKILGREVTTRLETGEIQRTPGENRDYNDRTRRQRYE